MAEKNIDVAQESSVQEVNEKIGSTGDTGGSASAGSIMAKLNGIVTNASRLTSTRATKIDNIGATGDTGGSATAGTVMGKLNALLTSWTSTRAGYLDNLNSRLTSTRAGYLDKLNSGVPVSSLSGKIIKSIQRGVVTINSKKKSELQEITVTVNAVTVNKSILLISGQHYSAFVSASTADSPKTISAQLTNSTTITFSRWDTDSSFTSVTIPYQLIEFY